MPPLELTDGVKACIEMAEAALGVKNIVGAAASACCIWLASAHDNHVYPPCRPLIRFQANVTH
jgi:hypothetical protein